MSVPDTLRHRANKVIFESYSELGYNYRMTDIQAAVGREQLKRLPEIVQRRRYLADRYHSLLSGVAGLRVPREPDWARSNWQSYCVRLPEGCDQRIVMQRMLDAGIATRRGVMCAHREPAFAEQPWSCGAGPGTCGCRTGTCARLGVSQQAQDSGVLLPLFHQMTEAEQDRVVAVLRVSLI
jgi:dTDP-4-amino-4,6-dideoxygalactose transaminase